MKTLGYIFALIRQAFAAAASNRKQFLFLSVGMFVQNAVFFLVWVIFFSAVHDVQGWRLKEIGLFQGILCLGVGSAFFAGEGVRRIADRIRDGELDIFILRPRHPLPQLITYEASAWSLGDIIYGLILMIVVGQPGWYGLFFALAAAFCVAVLFLAMVVIFQSLAFFIKDGGRLAEDLFMTMIIMGTAPQHTQGMLMKFVIFTVLPAGFLAILPVELVRQHSFLLLGAMAAAAFIYVALALAIFRAGLRRYTSATGWQV